MMKLVTIERSFIDTFADSWPCLALHDVNHIEAAFDSAGDLIDYSAYNSRGDDVFVATGAGLSELLTDARDYSVERDWGPGVIGPNQWVARTDAMDEWVAEHCGCGLNSKGEWSALLFEACGCDCRDH